MREDYRLTGSAVVVADFFDDKRPSLLFASQERVQLFRPVGNRWVEVSEEVFDGLDTADTITGSAADYDGDGDLDLILVGDHRHKLLRNDGEHFVDVSAEMGLNHTDWVSTSASWADLDLDGDLDLMIGNYSVYAFDADTTSDETHPSELYLQGPDGFTDVSHWLPEEVHEGYVFMSAFLDLNDDAYPELFTIHDYGTFASGSRLLLNEAGAGFTIDEPSGFHPRFNGMGFAIGDLNGDGGPELAQSSLNAISLRYAAPLDGGLTGWSWLYEFAESRGLEPPMDEPDTAQIFGWGTEFGDMDNDGDLDLTMIFGKYFTNDELAEQPDALWLQDRDRFMDVAPEWGVADRAPGRGLVVADINGDGWLDLVKRQLGLFPNLVHMARCGSANWIGIRLGQPETQNRFAIGSVVDVWVGKKRYRRWITSGSTSQFSSGPPEAHFGLGDLDRVDRVEVRWPDGTVSVVEDLETNRWFRLVRPW